jgi:uncharacterized protein with HEPN domain
MPSSDTRRVLKTITYHIELARRFVDGMFYDDFVADERTRYAVTRCLEIVSEASRRLPDDMKRRHPEVQWSRIAGAGNVYRHDYEDVLPGMLWATVQDHLQALEAAAGAELNR